MTTSQEKHSPREKLAYIAYSSTKRVRLCAPVIASRADVCRTIAQKLAEMPGAHDQVSVRIVSGSIVVQSKEETIDAEALLAQVRELLATNDEIQKKSATGPTKIARIVASAFSMLNDDVRGGLNHRADLAALMPVLLASVAMVQIFTTGRLPIPTWFNLTWWSFRFFLTFNKNAGDESATAVK